MVQFQKLNHSGVALAGETVRKWYCIGWTALFWPVTIVIEAGAVVFTG
jgi:hypothetical protein